MPPLPEAFLERMRDMLGEEYPAFLRAMNEPPALALRLNPARPGAAEAAAPFVDGAVPWAEAGRYLKAGEDIRPGAAIAHAAGAYYIQEASAMASAAVLDARPGERVLDLCAAPGGKSTPIAAGLGGEGLLVSNDPEPGRARILAGNLERMGTGNAIVVSALPDRLAARWPEGCFDAILVDAPCSGEGMFRRDPDSRAQWNPAAPQGCARRQAEILDQAARLLSPGGRLVYSTCTFNDLEDEGSVAGFLQRHPDFEPEDFQLPGVGASHGGMLRLWPHRLRGDGHFVARLRKAGQGNAQSAPTPIPPDRGVLKIVSDLEQAVGRLPRWIRAGRLFTRADRLYRAPSGDLPLDGIRVVSPGLGLARVGRSHVEPEHALAMALPPDCALRRAELSDNQARAFLRGESLPWEGERGWTLVLYGGMPLGWGKASEGALKNHLPKALRRPR